YLLVAAMLLFFSSPVFNLNTSIYRNMELLKKFNQVEFIRIFGNIIGILVLVPMFNIYGALVGIGISFFIVNLLSWGNFHKFLSIKKENIEFKTLKELFVYGFPLVLTMFSSVIISSSDQFLLGVFQGSVQVGIYAANYDILEKMLLFLNSVFMLATTPKLIKIYDKSGVKEARNFNSFIFEIFISLFLPLAFFIILNDKLFISTLTDKNYYYGRSLIVLITLSMLINIVNMYMIKGLTVIKNTKVIAKLYLIATVVNIVLNIILIPKFSLYGAIIATLVCYIALLAFSVTATKNHRVLTIKYKNSLTQIFVYLICFLLVDEFFNYTQKIWVSLLLFPVIFTLINITNIKKTKTFLKGN
ncbi:oligosaccharide flippase family protein, partial [Peribacillus butanolivorans]